MGGAKISDKVECINNLADRSDAILIGGALANLFFLARGYEIGISKVEAAGRDAAFSLLKTYGKLLVLPEDVVVAAKDFAPESIRTCEPHEVAPTEQILDIGPRTILAWATALKNSKTIVWNGPLGYIEKPPFHTGSSALCKVMGGLGKRTAFVVAGGGETVDVIREAGQMDHFDHVSTGGGAMLELLAGKELPGITALETR
jgi:phosphoglycerate kinase